jgi:hypothetical protein
VSYRRRRFVLASVPAATAGYIVLAADGDAGHAAVLSAVGGVLMGALCDVIGRRYDQQLAAKGVNLENCPVRPRVQMDFWRHPNDAALQHVRSAIGALGGQLKRELGDGILEFETPWTRHGAGEVIRVEPSGPDQATRLIITSRPKWDSTSIDFGRNVLHLKLIAENVAAALGPDNVSIGPIEDAASGRGGTTD